MTTLDRLRVTFASKRARALVLLTSSLALAPARVAESWVTELPAAAQQANEACKAGQLEECRTGVRRLIALTDGRPDFLCKLARTEARLGAQPQALRDLATCIRSGLAFDNLSTEPALDTLRASPRFAELQAEATRLVAPAVDFSKRLVLTDPALIAEDLAYDPTDHSFYISSVHERKIVRVAADGSVSDFLTAAQTPLWGVYAVAVDSERGILWATSSAGAESPPFDAVEDGKSAVLKFDLHSRTLLARYELADGRPHGFGDVALEPGGALLVSDGIDGGVYVVGPGSAGLRVVVAPGAMHSPQTPAPIPGTAQVLVPDYSRGIAVANLEGRAIRWLAHPPELALFGIDGLYLRGRTLIAVQNGTAPERVLLMTLDPSCSRITAWHTAVARAPGLGEPTHAAFVGADLYLLVNSGWDRVSDAGVLSEAPVGTPAEIWKLRWTGLAALRAASCPSR